MALKSADKKIVDAFIDGSPEVAEGARSSFSVLGGVLRGPAGSSLAKQDGRKIVWIGTGGARYQDDTYRYLKKEVPKNRFVGHGMSANGSRTIADVDAARELVLYTENTAKLWGPGNTQGKSIRLNLERKKAQGTLDPSKAPKLFEYLMDSAAKEYAREFANPSEWNTIFNKATRRLAAEEMATQYLEELSLQPNRGQRAPLGYVHDAATDDFLRPATREDMLQSLKTPTGRYTDSSRRRVYVRNARVDPLKRAAESARRRGGGGKKPPVRSYKDIIHEGERERYPFDYAVRNGSTSDEDWANELVLRGVILGFWLPAWASAMEEAGLSLPRNINEDTAPDPPEEVVTFAETFMWETLRKSAAPDLPLGELPTLVFGVDPNDEGEMESFGYHLAMEAQGTGISWEDDHPTRINEQIAVPRAELHVELMDPDDENSSEISAGFIGDWPWSEWISVVLR